MRASTRPESCSPGRPTSRNGAKRGPKFSAISATTSSVTRRKMQGSYLIWWEADLRTSSNFRRNEYNGCAWRCVDDRETHGTHSVLWGRLSSLPDARPVQRQAGKPAPRKHLPPQIWFPGSAWEPISSGLCPEARSSKKHNYQEHLMLWSFPNHCGGGAARHAFPGRAWERGLLSR
jgi:hypothetical protein